jgi:hypothetical protein
VDSSDDAFALTRARITQVIDDALAELETAADDEAAYRQASWIVETLRQATNTTAIARNGITARIQKSGQLSLAQLGVKIGVSKARAAEMMNAAKARRKDSQ